MPHGDEALTALREALRLSPDNLPLRLHLADTLVNLSRFDEAEKEYKAALSQSPDEPRVKLGLAWAYFKQAKNSAALVVVEDLIKSPHPPARTFVLYARLLLRAGDVERAVRQYKRAIDEDPDAGDAELAAQLGIRAEKPKFPPGAEAGSPFAAHRDDEDEEDDDDREVVDGQIRTGYDGAGGSGPAEVERPKASFKDVGGMEALKDEIRLKIIHPLSHPELYKAYGKAVGGGILMYGPPGCGKTHLARATAGEIKANFLSVGINDVLNMWLGNSEKSLHELFEQARRNRPCVLFFDEVDALAASRSDMRHSAARHLINQFLAEMDGMGSNNDGLLILAATNAPWHVDAAFRRPGRFDRILFVPPPDAPARAGILRILTRDKPVENLDYDAVARKSENFSGADLKAVVDVAVENKLREAMKTGIPRPLTTKDLLAAVSGVKPSTREWFSTARNYALYSNQGGAYDDILKHLKM